MVARGEMILFADADGATQFSDLDLLITNLNKLSYKSDGYAVSVGSRAHMVSTDAVVKVNKTTVLTPYFL